MLGWSHYLVPLHIPRPEARSFYEIEAARESWSVRELERQVASLLFERLAMNQKKTEQLLTLARQGQQVLVPRFERRPSASAPAHAAASTSFEALHKLRRRGFFDRWKRAAETGLGER